MQALVEAETFPAVNPPNGRLGQERRPRKVSYRQRKKEKSLFSLQFHISFPGPRVEQSRVRHLRLEAG